MTDSAWRPAAAGQSTAAEELAGYQDLVEVGRGGDSIVYRARQVSLGRMVAIKVLRVDDPARLARFVRELQITVELGRQHPNIVSVLATGTTVSGLPAIVMDYYEGGTLHDRLKAHGPMTVDEVISVGVVVADALAFAHERGVLHRDVKPQNILILPTTWVLADFGIARLAGSEHTASVETFTYRHAAPQILDGMPPTEADDIWSLGSTLFTILDGRPPFASDDPDDESALAYLRRARTEPHRDLSVPDSQRLAGVIHRCLAKRVEDRWQSAAELRDAFKALQHRAWEPAQHDEPGPVVIPHPAVPTAAPAVRPAAGPSLAKEPPAPGPAPLSAAEQAWAPKPDPLSLRSRTVVRPRTTAAAHPVAAAVDSAGYDARLARPVDPDPVALSVLAHAPGTPTVADASPTGAGLADLTGALDKDTGGAPGDRFRPAAGAASPPPPAGEPPRGDSAGRRRRRIIVILAATAVIIACVLVIGGRLLRQDADPRPGKDVAGTDVPTLSDAPPSQTEPVGKPDFEILITSSKVVGTTIELAWRDNTDDQATFVVHQVSPEREVLGQVPQGTEEFVIDNIPPDGKRHCFVVQAWLADGTYGQSKERCLAKFDPQPVTD